MKVQKSWQFPQRINSLKRKRGRVQVGRLFTSCPPFCLKCPLYPRKPTSSASSGMSAKGQERPLHRNDRPLSNSVDVAIHHPSLKRFAVGTIGNRIELPPTPGCHVPLAVRQKHDLAKHSAFAQHLVRASCLFERQSLRDQGLDLALFVQVHLHRFGDQFSVNRNQRRLSGFFQSLGRFPASHEHRRSGRARSALRSDV